MKALELFCGTKCAGKVLENMGYKVISLDFNKKFEPTICVDICDWDYTDYDPKEFDIIWASPECKTFTFSAGGKHRKKDNIMGKTPEAEDGNKMVDAMLKILEYFKPKKYFVENPLGLITDGDTPSQLTFGVMLNYGIMKSDLNFPMTGG